MYICLFLQKTLKIYFNTYFTNILHRNCVELFSVQPVTRVDYKPDLSEFVKIAVITQPPLITKHHFTDPMLTRSPQHGSLFSVLKLVLAPPCFVDTSSEILMRHKTFVFILYLNKTANYDIILSNKLF